MSFSVLSIYEFYFELLVTWVGSFFEFIFFRFDLITNFEPDINYKSIKEEAFIQKMLSILLLK